MAEAADSPSPSPTPQLADEPIDPQQLWADFQQWLQEADWSWLGWGALFQLGGFLIALLLALLCTRVASRIGSRIADSDWYQQSSGARSFIATIFGIKPQKRLRRLVFSFLLVLFTWLARFLFQDFGYAHFLLEIFADLVTAWAVIYLVTIIVRDRFWVKVVAFIAFSIAALSILTLLDEVTTFLDYTLFNLGDKPISLLLVFKGIAILLALLWLAGILSSLISHRLKAFPDLTASQQVLFGKLIRIALVAVAFLVTLKGLGINLTGLAIFGGALGVGLGFGLQTVVSNLVSGFILLMDKSIKPGDVIEIEETYGWINNLGARYVSILTRDGTEHLIPNEDLIKQRVINWSFSNNNIRCKAPIGISYHSDVRKAMEICEKAAIEESRVLNTPSPLCVLRGFGDSSVDLELRFWINDPQDGVANITSKVLLRVWDKFHEEGIEIPFPQRDLHFKSPDALRIQLEKEE